MTYGILNDTNTQIATFTAPLTVKSNQPVFSSDTLALSRVAIKRNAQRWELDTNLAPLVETANELFVHLVTKGSSEGFNITMPQNYGAQLKLEEIALNKKLTVAVNTAGSTSLSIFTDMLIKLPSGTFITIGVDPKVYMVMSHTTVLNIFPELRLPTIEDTSVNFRDVKMKVKYDTDVISGMVYSDGIMMSTGQVKLIEAL
jgi:hypothetical protein